LTLNQGSKKSNNWVKAHPKPPVLSIEPPFFEISQKPRSRGSSEGIKRTSTGGSQILKLSKNWNHRFFDF